jgi:hypothetical protein
MKKLRKILGMSTITSVGAMLFGAMPVLASGYNYNSYNYDSYDSGLAALGLGFVGAYYCVLCVLLILMLAYFVMMTVALIDIAKRPNKVLPQKEVWIIVILWAGIIPVVGFFIALGTVVYYLFFFRKTLDEKSAS